MNRRARRAARHNPPPAPPPAIAAPAAPATTLHFPEPPAPMGERLVSMDVLRGFAVMAILLMNIVSFAMPEAAYVNPRAWGPQTTANGITWALSFILVDGKMRGLFSLLFGGSMLMMMEKAAMDGRDPVRAHLIRMAWLMAFGVAHYLLLWWGDILMVYALVGSVALLFVRRDPLDLAKLAFLAFGLHIVTMLATMVPAWRLAAAATAPGAGASLISAYDALLDSFSRPGSADIAREVTTYLGPWNGIFADHLVRLPGQILLNLHYYGFDTLGFMLLGMAMLKSGFLNGNWSTDQYRQTARHCLTIGLPPMIGLALWDWHRDFSTLTVFGGFMLWSFPWRIPLAVGYAALILWLLQKRGAAGYQRIAAVGRAAFSNYLGSSLVMTAIFYGWGLGRFGSVSRSLLTLFVLGAWGLMLLWSKPWLDRFAYGPFEWAWRSLARGRMQKMRRAG